MSSNAPNGGAQANYGAGFKASKEHDLSGRVLPAVRGSGGAARGPDARARRELSGHHLRRYRPLGAVGRARRRAVPDAQARPAAQPHHRWIDDRRGARPGLGPPGLGV